MASAIKSTPRYLSAVDKAKIRGKSFSKPLNGISARLKELDKRWQHSVPFCFDTLAEDYLKAGKALIFKCRKGVGSTDHVNPLQRFIIVCYLERSDCNTFAPYGKNDILQTNPPPLEWDEVVFVKVGDVIELRDKQIASACLVMMRFNIICEEGLSLTPESSYWSLVNGTYKALPVVSDGKGGFRGVISPIIRGPNKPHPAVIEGLPHSATSLSCQNLHNVGDSLISCNMEAIASSLLIDTRGHIKRLSIDKLREMGIKVVDQYVGPLEF